MFHKQLRRFIQRKKHYINGPVMIINFINNLDFLQIQIECIIKTVRKCILRTIYVIK